MKSGDRQLPGATGFGANAMSSARPPMDAESLFRSALEAEDAGRPAAAARLYRAALDIDPDLTGAWINLGECLRRLDLPDQAAAAFREVVRRLPAFADGHVALAAALRETGALDEAVRSLREAIRLEPAHVDAYATLGVCLQDRGEFEAASECFERALELDPTRTGLLYSLAVGDRARPGDPLLARIEKRLAEGGLDNAARSDLCFAAAKRLDDLGEHDRAFARYREANDLRRADRPFDADAWTRAIDEIMRTFEPGFFAARRDYGDQSELPVFVVGMPRSGTTLVEQILASHPRVHGAGELRHLSLLAHRLPALIDSGAPYPAAVADMTAEQSRGLARSYLERLARNAGDARRVVDKLPSNFLRLGLVAMLLPAARVIHCRRDALDTCLSCFCQNFRGELPYTHDLADLGRYYRQYERLMAYWRKVLPLEILDVRYESLVTDLEGEARRMIAFLGLEWDDACLRFHENRGPVRTASFWQVRRPVHTGSIGRWRRFERHLEPLRGALGGGPEGGRESGSPEGP